MKYRVWDKVNKEMILPSHENHRTTMTLRLDGSLCDPTTLSVKGGDPRPRNYCRDYRDFIVMRYTGLDRNSFEIYAGDIILWPEENIKFVIEWSEEDGGMVAIWRNPLSCGGVNPEYLSHFEVIGNIHELLKEQS